MCSATPLDREASPADVARIAAAVAFDFRFTYFGTGAFPFNCCGSIRHPDGTPSRKLLREFCGHLAKPGDETVVLYADGTAVEIPNF